MALTTAAAIEGERHPLRRFLKIPGPGLMAAAGAAWIVLTLLG